MSKVVPELEAGDSVFIEAGRYEVGQQQIHQQDWYNVGFAFLKSGSKEKPIVIQGISEKGKRPIFDFSKIETQRRFTAFLLQADYIKISNIETVGVPVPLVDQGRNVQSENFRLKDANHCTLDRISAHNGMGIGVYIVGYSSYNKVLNSDAYENFDAVNRNEKGDFYGGNDDGFGCHVKAGCPGNVFFRCNAWLNSDDGFDLINCYSPVTFDHCIAALNGLSKEESGSIVRRGDGNGFKAGGYGMKKVVEIDSVPKHTIIYCSAFGNKANGFYANHHLGGNYWAHNTAWKNARDYYMLNRKSATEIVDVEGYGHKLEDCRILNDSTSEWVIESEASDYRLLLQDTIDIYAPKGFTLWNRKKLKAPCTIEYDACIVDEGKEYERLSDLNCFWMANDPKANTVFDRIPWRMGNFPCSYSMNLYYLGYGGNHNSTTRFRRYNADERGIKDAKYRPAILKEYKDADHLLKANHWYHIIIKVNKKSTSIYVDGKLIAKYNDPKPLQSGWFGFRTTKSHARLANFKTR